MCLFYQRGSIYWSLYPTNYIFLFIVDQDLSHITDDEAYDYKFVKWMIKEKVNE